MPPLTPAGREEANRMRTYSESTSGQGQPRMSASLACAISTLTGPMAIPAANPHATAATVRNTCFTDGSLYAERCRSAAGEAGRLQRLVSQSFVNNEISNDERVIADRADGVVEQ